MTKKIARDSVRQNANRRQPEGLTQEIVEAIRNLEGSDPKVAYLREVFLEKFVSSETDPPEVRRNRAIAKWLAAERDNEATNVRLVITPEEYNILPRVTVEAFVEKAKEFTLAIVGEMPSLTDLIGGFSGGATTSKRRTESHPAQKFLGQADITERARPWWDLLWEAMPGWSQFGADLEIRTVPGNVMFTVPKNTSIDRVACKEPDLNMFMQKGLGKRIRSCLRRVGIDLNDQSRNRDLAREGSRDGSLATLDLSSASDSVTRELVFQLMPIGWWAPLDALRCEVTLIDGVEHSNEMFSSMGNGFTFELESLLFYVLARTTAYFRNVRGVISVYGDDLVVPTHLAQDLAWVLDHFGFQVNSLKSWWDGPFRESCGGHFVNGRDVTPFYLRSPVSRLTDLIHVANAIRKWSEDEDLEINDPRVYSLWSSLRDRVPRRLWGGREYSSITQLVTPDRPHSALRAKKDRKGTGTGGYIHWLCATNDREQPGDGLVTSERSEDRPWYQVVKARRTVTRLNRLFLEEVGNAE